MSQIWIVEQSSGSYEDHRSWPVKAFLSASAAAAWVEDNNIIFKQQLAADRELQIQRQEAFGELKESFGVTYEHHITDPAAKQEYQAKAQLIQQQYPYRDTDEQWGYSLINEPIDLISQ